jgi:hypothetical protein
MLNSLLSTQCFEEGSHAGRSLGIAKEIAATVFEQVANNLDVHTGEFIERDLEAVEDDVLGHYAKLGQLGEISYIAHAHLSKELLRLSALKTPKFLIKIGRQTLWDIRKILSKGSHQTRVDRQEINPALGDIRNSFDEPIARCFGIDEAKVQGKLIDLVLVLQIRKFSK